MTVAIRQTFGDIPPVDSLAMIRVLIVDDDRMVADSLAQALAAAGLETLGVAIDPRQAVTMAATLAPDVILCDVMFGGEPSGLRLPPSLLEADLRIPVLFLSSFASPWFVRTAKDAGAAGYLFKAQELTALVAGLTTVARGGSAFPEPPAAACGPTHREVEVLRGVAAGLTNDQIAHQLGISSPTVATHLRRMVAKYETQGRTGLVMLALQKGWLVRLPEGLAAEPDL